MGCISTIFRKVLYFLWRILQFSTRWIGIVTIIDAINTHLELLFKPFATGLKCDVFLHFDPLQFIVFVPNLFLVSISTKAKVLPVSGSLDSYPSSLAQIKS